MLIRARTVLPMGAPALDDGAVLVRGERIEAVDRFSALRGRDDTVVDLGEAVLLPGLINAHCHLDYTGMAGQLRPGRTFTDWIQAIVALKSQWSFTEFAESWLNGARMLLRSGTTTVADIEAVPELLPDVRTCTPLNVVSCLELMSIRSRLPAHALVRNAVATAEQLPAGARGLSPHAPYTTTGELLRETSRAARERGWLLTTHVAESADEFEMFRARRGAMFDWLATQRDISECDGRSPMEHLARSEGLGAHCLVAHANYLAPGDAESLGRSRTSVVHCPRSHAFFGHQKFPLQELTAAEVNICLGTDSLATTARNGREPLALDMFAEMHAFNQAHPDCSPERILRMATVNGAAALGRTGELGALLPGTRADLIAVPLQTSLRDVFAAIVAFRGEVTASMVGGAWARNIGKNPIAETS